MNSQRVKEELISVAFMLVGCVIFSLALNLFIVPCNLVLGGTTGGAVVVNKLFGIPTGAASIMLNIPVMIIGWRIIGWQFIARTAATSMVLGVMIDALDFVSFPEVDPILAALYGGILLGIAIGIFYRYNWSSGGSEVLGRSWCTATGIGTMGQSMAIIDGIVVVGGNMLLGEPANMLLALVTIFVCSKATDMIISGYDKGILCFIITNKGDELYHLVRQKYNRGMTCMNGKGMYTGDPHQVMMTVVKRAQFSDYKKMIKEADPDAFVIVNETYDVFGRGFKEIY